MFKYSLNLFIDVQVLADTIKLKPVQNKMKQCGLITFIGGLAYTSDDSNDLI